MKKIAIILADGVEETEFIAVGDVLRRLGMEVTVAGLHRLEVKGAHDFGLKADRLLAECSPAGFDAVFLPGGMGGALAMYNSGAVVEFVREMERSGKIVSAICAAPIVLAKAGVLEGKKFTMYPGLGEYLPDGLCPRRRCRRTGRPGRDRKGARRGLRLRCGSGRSARGGNR